MMRTNTIICGDAVAALKTLPDACIQMACTSPPYYCKRDYDVPGQVGLESSYDEYIARLCDVFDEVKRVLRPDGTCWVNLADSYGGDGCRATPSPLVTKSGRVAYIIPPTPRSDIPRKSLSLIPFRFAIEMVRRGWLLRNTLVWHKPNAVPESVTDRFTNDFEYLFFFSKSKRYYFEQQFEPATEKGTRRGHRYWRNKRCVWTIPTQGFAGNHYAVYPEALVKTPVIAGCPEGGIVLDPFLGSGTTAVVAETLGRQWLGIELNPAYCALAVRRLAGTRDKLSHSLV